MTDSHKLLRFKREAEILRKLLLQESPNSRSASEALDQLDSVFIDVREMEQYRTTGRLRLDHLFIESDLGNNKELMESYSRFANLAEGIEL
ncbi:Uncharacterised protein [BD1-7 clade bacterium]|uniref:Uncharacterized protein n=1 Tax=BD1-7 clade bacterium TaxID=2029982 RepID=A0A5S9PG96_9GAMM|nr:Uncharacterised protein [BD1-7 clade bacterium]CAA0102874.1 Uncharacterised protein [BD1-7 clade bacterium]